MTILTSETFEAGPDGAAVTAGNTTFDTVLGTSTYTDTSPIEGTFSALSTDGGAGYRWDLATVGEHHLAFTVTFGTMPAAIMYLGDCRAGSTRVANFRVEPDGTVAIRSNFTAVDSAPAGTITVGDTVTFDWRVDWTAGTQELRIYIGGSLVDTLTGACNQAGTGITVTGVLESGSTADLTYDELYDADDWTVAVSADVTDPVASVAIVERRATWDAAGDLTGIEVDLDATGSTDDVGVVSYSWTATGGTFDNAASATPTWSGVASAVATCEVADAGGNTATDDAVCDVGAGVSGDPLPVRGHIVASA